MDINLWMNKAQESIEKMPINTTFLAKDLFEGAEWNGLEKGERLHFGREFKNAVKEGKFPGIIYTGKAQNNSAQYTKEG